MTFMELVKEWKKRSGDLYERARRPYNSSLRGRADVWSKAAAKLEYAIKHAPSEANVAKLLRAAKLALADQLERTCMNDELYDALTEAIKPLDDVKPTMEVVGTFGRDAFAVIEVCTLGIYTYVVVDGADSWTLEGDELEEWLAGSALSQGEADGNNH